VDIVVGEGQSFGNAMNFGGPYLGFMATKKDFVRQLPGRIVGETVDSEGKKGYILTLQAREQHIRRERACSNICSNEALCALAATVQLAMLGKTGIKELAELNLQKAHYLADKLKEKGFSILNKVFYNEFTVKVDDAKKVAERLAKQGILVNAISNDNLLLCVTELNTKEEMDKLVELI
jgi:glycine dehydrogenase subunit 1